MSNNQDLEKLLNIRLNLLAARVHACETEEIPEHYEDAYHLIKEGVEAIILQEKIDLLESLKHNYWSLEDDRGDVLQDFYIDEAIAELKGTIEQ